MPDARGRATRRVGKPLTCRRERADCAGFYSCTWLENLFGADIYNGGVFFVEPVDAASSRLIVCTRFRDDTWWGPAVTRFAFEPVHSVMERRMLLGSRDRAEGRLTRVLDALVTMRFVVGVTLLLLRRARGRRWLALPALLALLLAPNAYHAFGLLFILFLVPLVVTASSVLGARRPTGTVDAGHVRDGAPSVPAARAGSNMG